MGRRISIRAAGRWLEGLRKLGCEASQLLAKSFHDSASAADEPHRFTALRICLQTGKRLPNEVMDDLVALINERTQGLSKAGRILATDPLGKYLHETAKRLLGIEQFAPVGVPIWRLGGLIMPSIEPRRAFFLGPLSSDI